jgi:hypothetical protein
MTVRDSQERRNGVSFVFGTFASICAVSFTAIFALAAVQKSHLAAYVLVWAGISLAAVAVLTGYLCAASIWSWRPFARLADAVDSTQVELQFREQLEKMAAIVAGENGDQVSVLVDRGELPVPWKVTDHDRGADADELCRRFRAMDTQQMVILGAPGAGKTTMAALLVAGLLKMRDPASPEPSSIAVRISVATWTPKSGALRAWIGSRLGEEYPRLLACLDEVSHLGRADSLLGQCLIPVLDGFDELSGALRVKFLRALATDLRGQPVILASRVPEYYAAKSDTGGLLPALEVVMDQVQESDARTYLDRARPTLPADWDAVFASKRGDLQDMLASPLFLWLLAEVYAGVTNDPADLLALTEPESVQSHLLRRLVPAAFEREARKARPRGREPSSLADGDVAFGYLAWLASRLARRKAVSINWWRLPDLLPRMAVILVAAALAGAAFGFAGGQNAFVCLVTAALILGAWFGCGFGRGYSSARMKGAMPSDRFGFGGAKEGADPDVRAHLYRLGGAHFGVAVFWGTAVIVGWGTSSSSLRHSLISSQAYGVSTLERFAIAVAICTVVAFVGGHVLGLGLRSLGLHDTKQSAARAATPRRSLRQDGKNAVKVAPIAYVVLAVAMIAVFHFSGPRSSIPFTLVTASACVVTYGLTFPSWLRYRIAHLLLAVPAIIPWCFLDFLEDAHEVGVLGLTGLSYKFRHELLRQSLVKPSRRPALNYRESTKVVGPQLGSEPMESD